MGPTLLSFVNENKPFSPDFGLFEIGRVCEGVKEDGLCNERKKLGIASSDFMVLTAGGSRGARTINRAMEGVHRHFRETPGICLYHVTGRGEYDQVCRDLDGVDGDGRFGAGSRLVPYQDDMPAALAAADLVIYRAGAVGLAELAARGLPSILIPYPYAAEDHQTYNARVLVAARSGRK